MHNLKIKNSTSLFSDDREKIESDISEWSSVVNDMRTLRKTIFTELLNDEAFLVDKFVDSSNELSGICLGVLRLKDRDLTNKLKYYAEKYPHIAANVNWAADRLKEQEPLL